MSLLNVITHELREPASVRTPRRRWRPEPCARARSLALEPVTRAVTRAHRRHAEPRAHTHTQTQARCARVHPSVIQNVIPNI